MFDALKAAVCEANRELARLNLAILTWGNVSGADRAADALVIKPSGVPYEVLKPSDMVVVNLSDGRVREGALRPSSDTATHRALYDAFPAIGAVAHTHSRAATLFAQARRPIPCLGTTHADTFSGPIPVTRLLRAEEVGNAYETATGQVIAEQFASCDPLSIPAALVAGHGPFTWGLTPADAVRHSLILEEVAALAAGTLHLSPQAAALPDYLAHKHHSRKHGPRATYGQPMPDSTGDAAAG